MKRLLSRLGFQLSAWVVSLISLIVALIIVQPETHSETVGLIFVAVLGSIAAYSFVWLRWLFPTRKKES